MDLECAEMSVPASTSNNAFTSERGEVLEFWIGLRGEQLAVADAGQRAQRWGGSKSPPLRLARERGEGG
jgi:hypothetical protein